MFADVVGIELDLIFQTSKLFLAIGTDPAVSRYPKRLFHERLFYCCRLYINSFRHDKTSMIITENSVYHGGFIKSISYISALHCMAKM